MTTTKLRSLTLALTTALLAGCGGGFDARDTCEQTAACLEKAGQLPSGSNIDAEIDECTDQLDGVYDQLNGAQQDQLDDVYEECSGQTSCDFVVCFCEAGDPNSPECQLAAENQ